MHANSLLSRTVLLAGLLGTALVLSAGPLAGPADARGRHGNGKAYGHRSHSRTVVVHDSCAPNYVVHRYSQPVRYESRYYRPWYSDVRRVYVNSAPFYYNAGLNVYFGGVNLNFAFGDPAPYGYAYLDPYCGIEFSTVSAYQQHLCRHHHEPALRVVCENDFDY